MAANRYEYGTSPYKVEPDYKKTKKEKSKGLKIVQDIPRQEIKISKEQKKKQLKLTLIVIALFALLLTISYRNSQINVEFNKVQTLKKKLSSIQKENEQLEVTIQNSLNFNNIEKMAKEKLGMQKLTNKQAIYVSLPKKDYVESATEEIKMGQEKNWFEQFVDKIFNR